MKRNLREKIIFFKKNPGQGKFERKFGGMDLTIRAVSGSHFILIFESGVGKKQ